MRDFNQFEWIVIIAAAACITHDWISFRLFENKISKPLKGVKLKRFQTSYRQTEKLYVSYKTLPTKQLKAVKLHLKAFDFSTNIASQVADLMVKFFFAIILAMFSFLATTMNLNVSFLNSNKEQISNWGDQITDSFKLLISIMENFNTLLVISLSMFIVTLNHTLFLKMKKDKQSQHLIIIEEIEKELKDN